MPLPTVDRQLRSIYICRLQVWLPLGLKSSYFTYGSHVHVETVLKIQRLIHHEQIEAPRTAEIRHYNGVDRRRMHKFVPRCREDGGHWHLQSLPQRFLNIRQFRHTYSRMSSWLFKNQPVPAYEPYYSHHTCKEVTSKVEQMFHGTIRKNTLKSLTLFQVKG